MLWRCLIALVGASSLFAAVLPRQINAWEAISVQPSAPTDLALAQEFGFRAGETGRYRKAGGETLQVTAWRFEDATGARAALLAELPSLSKRFPQTVGLANRNYVLVFNAKPASADIDTLWSSLPGRNRTSLPTLSNYLPRTAVKTEAIRYILGPVSLARFLPEVSPAVMDFSLGAEAEIAELKSGGKLVLIAYPTPQLARKKLPEYERLGIARRAGPLVALVVGAPDAGRAQALLEGIRYETQLMWNEQPPKNPGGVAEMLISIFVLIGGLLVLATLFGLGFGGFRILLRRFGIRSAENDFTALHIEKQ
jgi:hypothetical protein